MDKFNQPTKEQVRRWMLDRRDRQAPLPNVEQIRRQLNWGSSTESPFQDIRSGPEPEPEPEPLCTVRAGQDMRFVSTTIRKVSNGRTRHC
jgi:hypothetical protein